MFEISPLQILWKCRKSTNNIHWSCLQQFFDQRKFLTIWAMATCIHNEVKTLHFSINCDINRICLDRNQFHFSNLEGEPWICTNFFHVHRWHTSTTSCCSDMFQAFFDGFLEEFIVVDICLPSVKPFFIDVEMPSRQRAPTDQHHFAILFQGKLSHLYCSQTATQHQKLFCGWLPWVVNQAENQNETSTSLEQPKGQLELLLVQAHRELRQRLWLSALDIDSLALDHQQGHPSHPSHPSHPDSSPTLSLWNLHHDQKLKPLFHEEMCEEGKRQDLNKNLRKAHWRVGSKGRCQLLATMPVLDWQLQIPEVHDDDLFDVQMPVNYSCQRYLDVLLQVNVTI